MAEAIRVLVADELPIVREGVRSLLDAADDLTCIGEAHTGHQALQLSQRLVPDVLLLSLDLPELSPLDFLTQVKQHCSATRVLLTTNDTAQVRKYRLVANGARGCVLKTESRKAIIHAIRTVAHGKIWFSQPILEKTLEPDAAESRSVSEAGLTRRELKVLRLMARGWDIDLTKQNKCAKM
jgi:DNA-binding NarL/FixJ family response regulator